jgi:hypothetical protein
MPPKMKRSQSSTFYDIPNIKNCCIMVYILSYYSACREAEVTEVSLLLLLEKCSQINKRLDMSHLFKMHKTPPKDK